MTEQLITIITGSAPFACMAIAATCVAIMFRNLRKAGSPAQTSFGQWPQDELQSSPTPGISSHTAATAARRVSLGLAAGIAVGEALFLLFPRGLLT